MKLRRPSIFFFIPIIIFFTVSLSGCSLLDQKNKAGLQVITNDVPSTVFLDGQYLEKTPFIERNLKPGEYSLKIQPDDPQLIAHETTINLRPGLLSVVTWKPGDRPETSGGVIYEMEPLKNKKEAEVSFVSIPDGAIVSLQGKEIEFTPVIITKVEPGTNEFEMTLPSYETQRHTLNIVSGYRMIVKVKLAKINLSAPQAASSSSSTPSASPNSNAITNSPSASSSSQVKILSTDYFQNSKEVLKVRNQPSSDSQEIGVVIVGQTYPYLNETINNWHKISFDNQEGWVSGQYSQIVGK